MGDGRNTANIRGPLVSVSEVEVDARAAQRRLGWRMLDRAEVK